jgi:hypothetical protein
MRVGFSGGFRSMVKGDARDAAVLAESRKHF